MALEPLCAPPGHAPEHGAPPLVTAHGIVSGRLEKAAPEWGNAHVGAARVREVLGPAIFDAYLKTCSIRNPFDKMVSAFFFDVGNNRRKAGRTPLDTLGPDRQVALFRAYVARKSERGHFGSPRDIDRRVTHIDGRPIIDRWLRMERMEDDLAALCADIGARRADVALHSVKRHTRAGDARPIGEWYDAPTARIVRGAFAWMFAAGDYPDDPASAERASAREIR